MLDAVAQGLFRTDVQERTACRQLQCTADDAISTSMQPSPWAGMCQFPFSHKQQQQTSGCLSGRCGFGRGSLFHPQQHPESRCCLPTAQGLWGMYGRGLPLVTFERGLWAPGCITPQEVAATSYLAPPGAATAALKQLGGAHAVSLCPCAPSQGVLQLPCFIRHTFQLSAVRD